LRLRSLIALALHNLADNELRSWLLGLCAFAIAAFAVTTVLVVHGAQESLHLAADRLGADVVVVPRGAATQVDGALLMGTVSKTWLPSSDVARIAAVPGVAVASPQVYLESLSHASCCAVSRMFIVAYDPRTDFTVGPWLHQSLGGALGLEQAVGGCRVTVPVNHNIMLYGYTMWLRGKLEPTGTNLDQTLFVTLPTAYAMAHSSRTTAVRPLVIPRDSVSSVMVKVRPGQAPARIARSIADAVPGVTAIVSPQMFAAYRSQISGLLRILLLVLGLLLVLAAAVTAALFAMAANERRRELGVLRALGASCGAVLVALLGEALTLALVGGLAGALVAAVGVGLFHTLLISALGFPFLFPAFGRLAGEVVLGLALALVVVGAAAALPALRVSRQEPADAMRQ
jgi:putative ABC transport system permease protein